MEIAVKWYMDHRSGPYSWCFCRRRVGTIDPLFALLFHPLFDSSVPHCFWFFPVRSWLLPRRSQRMPRHQNPEKRLTIRFFHIIILNVIIWNECYGMGKSEEISCLPVRRTRHIPNTTRRYNDTAEGRTWEQTFYPFVRACMFKWKKTTPAGAQPFSFSVPGPMCAPDAQIAGGNWWWDESNLKKQSNAC